MLAEDEDDDDDANLVCLDEQVEFRIDFGFVYKNRSFSDGVLRLQVE